MDILKSLSSKPDKFDGKEFVLATTNEILVD